MRFDEVSRADDARCECLERRNEAGMAERARGVRRLASPRASWLVTVGLCVVMSACTTTTEGSGNDFANKYCETMAPCCANAGKPVTMKDCKGALSSATGFNQAKGDACLAALRAKQNEPSFCATAFATEEACKGVFGGNSGSAKPGEPCVTAADCASDPRGKIRCIGRAQSSAICQVVIEAKAEGDGPCTGTRDALGTSHEVDVLTIKEDIVCDAASGIYCDDATWTCAKLAELGESCKDDTGCVRTAVCEPRGPLQNPWICVERVAIGSMCRGETLDNNCVAGARCDWSTRQCVALKEEGSFCMSLLECASRNCSNGKCAATGTDASGLLCDSN